MKFLHISDLHIGKRFNDISLLDDQKAVLTQICGIAAEEKCEAVLIAGDVYDKTSPSADAMSVFDSFLISLAKLDIPVFIIAGNHDSQQRIAYLSELVKNSGIYVCGNFSGRLCSHRLRDEFGEICVHLLPFIKPADVRKFYPEEKIETYDDAFRVVLENSEIDSSVRNIIVCHQFFTGAVTCESEIFAVGGLDNISADHLNEFDYAALGHIHGPQYVMRPEIRYCGSPLKYSFSEAAHRKSATIAELCEKGNVKISTVSLTQPHEVREVRGGMDELMELPYSEDFVRVTVTDESVPPDARASLLTVFPNMMRFIIENSKTGEIVASEDTADVESKTPTELFCDFYRLMNNNVPPENEHISLIEKVLERLGDTQS